MTRRGRLALAASVWFGLLWVGWLVKSADAGDENRALSLSWDKEMLTVRGNHLPGR